MPMKYPLGLVVPIEGRWVKDNRLACGRIGSNVSTLSYRQSEDLPRMLDEVPISPRVAVRV